MVPSEILPDHEALSRRAADWLLARLRERPTSLVCLAAGGTPSRTYELLAEHGRREPRLFSGCRMLKLDEWGGLAMDDPATCEHQLRKILITPLGLAGRFTAFQSNPADPQAECARIRQWLADNGPIDVCVLGLGRNGHVGFNEPAAYLQPHAHLARLSEASQQHPMVGGCHEVPSFGLTLGMADLLQSREILMLVSGAAKQQPLERLLTGQITTEFPASFVHLHPRATLLCDRAATIGA